MADKFKNSKIKAMERKLLYTRIKLQTSKARPVLGFTLPSDSVVLERHLANYAKASEKHIGVICAEDNKERFEKAKEKLKALKNNYFDSAIAKGTDYKLFNSFTLGDRGELSNKLDFVWHDWCGPLTEENIKTLLISTQFMREGGLLAVTVNTRRKGEAPGLKDYMDYTRIHSLEDLTITDKKAYGIPTYINFRLSLDKQQPIKKGLKLLDAMIYSVSIGETRHGASNMLFYIFSVHKRDKEQHNYEKIKRTADKHLKRFYSHNGRIFVEKKHIEGLE